MELCTGGSLYTLLEHPSNAYGFSEKDCKDIIRDVGKEARQLISCNIIFSPFFED